MPTPPSFSLEITSVVKELNICIAELYQNFSKLFAIISLWENITNLRMN
jgi:hypothetical protein